jgi:hypothetical protein
MLGVLALAALGCALGLLDRPATGNHGVQAQAIDLLRVLATACLAVALLIGPGVVWRALSRPRNRLSLGFLPLPGLFLMIAVGGIAWALGGVAEPRTVCLAAVAPVLGCLVGGLLFAGPEDVFNREEQRCLLIVGCAFGLAVARALWSLGPEGELYGGTISRTLEVGDRSDSRISFIVPQLVGHHAGPYSSLGSGQYAPYNFSSRGPLPGLGSVPIVFLAGGHPPAEYPEQPWQPFDPQGFMAYRLAMMAFACTAFIAVWDLTRRLAGHRAAQLAVLLAATTPFLVHEIWFTWPKLLAASFVLLAAICVIEGRPGRGGLLAGLGYLMHPIALVSLPVLGLIALWPLCGASWKRPQLTKLLLFGVGVAVFLLAWRLVNGAHYDQSIFLDYLRQAGGDLHPQIGHWLTFRLESIANTLVPLLLIFTSASSQSINVFGGVSPPVVHFFFQYWDTLPFGVAIVFFPLLVIALWRAAHRWTWPVLATVALPFALFALYWGFSSAGLMREGLQTWALTLFVVIGCEQAASGFGWLQSKPIRALLSLRVLEVLAVAMAPTLVTRQELVDTGFWLTDTVAILAMLGFSACLAALVWSAPRAAGAPPAPGGDGVSGVPASGPAIRCN